MGYPGYPHWGTPSSRSDRGHLGTPHQATLPPLARPGSGTPPGWTWLGYPLKVWTEKQSETITSRLVLRTWVVNMKYKLHISTLQDKY